MIGVVLNLLGAGLNLGLVFYGDPTWPTVHIIVGSFNLFVAGLLTEQATR